MGRRAKLLVPRGWQLDSKETHLSRDALLPGERTRLKFKPRPSEVPDWLRRLLGLPDYRGAYVFVDAGAHKEALGYGHEVPADGVEVTVYPVDPAGWADVWYRMIATHRPILVGVAGVMSPKEHAFDEFHSSICNSFRIE